MKRDQFLGRVTSALRGAALPVVTGPDRAPVISFPDPVERFVAEATAVDTEVVRVPDATAAFDAVGAVFETNGVGSYVAWDDLEGVAPGWDEWRARSDYEQVDATVGRDSATRMNDQARMGAVRIGITTADSGIAATGSLVLCHGPGRPRSASLLVQSHIALLPVSRIVPSLADAMEQAHWDDTSNIAVITGPSRTGDIESILTLGVHGPRHLHIILIG
ncbi:MAG: lactate utilization protein [Actinomycetota bacterium]|nr:lactate utilization protein [Actinomycetota bacterium]